MREYTLKEYWKKHIFSRLDQQGKKFEYRKETGGSAAASEEDNASPFQSTRQQIVIESREA